MHILIERLFLYRRILQNAREDGRTDLFSHELASLASSTSEQVRRDLMLVGAEGHRRRGYNIEKLLALFDNFLHADEAVPVVLVGVGHLGRAILTYFSGYSGNIRIEAAFDANPARSGRVISGCRCYSMEEMEEVTAHVKPKVAILAVPATAAHPVAMALVHCGVRAILNFAPVRLRLPSEISVENMDVTLTLQKLAFAARGGRELQAAARDASSSEHS